MIKLNCKQAMNFRNRRMFKDLRRKINFLISFIRIYYALTIESLKKMNEISIFSLRLNSISNSIRKNFNFHPQIRL